MADLTAFWGALVSIKDALLVVIALVTAVITIRKWAIRPLEKLTNEVKEANKRQDENIEELRGEVQKMHSQINNVDKNQADMLWDHLTQLHDYHCYESGFCRAADKKRIATLYESYHGRGYNHLAETYMTDIERLPEHPLKRRRGETNDGEQV